MFIFTISIFIIFIFLQFVYFLVPLFTSKPKIISDRTDNKGISVLIPAYNEALTIKNCINAYNKVDYSKICGIIINDGSTDNTMEVLDGLLDLEVVKNISLKRELKYNSIKRIYKSKINPSIYVIDKINGGKADALNAGIDFANTEVVITLDADSMLREDSIKYVDAYFDDEKVVATGGTVLIVQGTEVCDNVITPKFKGNGLLKHQILHYLQGFFIRKQAQSFFNSIVVISGAFGAFKKDMLINVKGFRTTVGEDMDITLKIYKYIHENNLDKKLVYTPEAICYTECPENMNNFLKQRFRWQKAFIDCIVEYWNDLFTGLPTKLSLFFALDGFIFGTISAFLLVLTLITSLLMGTGFKSLFYMYFFTIIIDEIQCIQSIILARKFNYKLSFYDIIHAIIFTVFDKFTYKFIGIYVNTIGTIKFFVEGESWGYIERKGEAKIV